jgi:hypothetical protein
MNLSELPDAIRATGLTTEAAINAQEEEIGRKLKLLEDTLRSLAKFRPDAARVARVKFLARINAHLDQASRDVMVDRARMLVGAVQAQGGSMSAEAAVEAVYRQVWSDHEALLDRLAESSAQDAMCLRLLTNGRIVEVLDRTAIPLFALVDQTLKEEQAKLDRRFGPRRR